MTISTASAGSQAPVARDLYFVAVGDAAADLIGSLASHFEAKFRVPIRTLAMVAVHPSMRNPERSQLIADTIIHAIRAAHPEISQHPRSRIIGITEADIYMRAMENQWRFTFSLRSPDARVAIVSYARMNPVNLGDAPDEELMRARLRKMLAKNIGIMYFGLPASSNPRSMLFRNILGVDDLDRMTEEFDPKRQ